MSGSCPLLRRRGVRCKLHEPNSELQLGQISSLMPPTAQGYEIHGSHPQPTCPVLAVDIPSGVGVPTGTNSGSLQADRTITFGALKPGLILEPGASQAGKVETLRLVFKYHLKMNLITDQDLRELLSQRSATITNGPTPANHRGLTGNDGSSRTSHTWCLASRIWHSCRLFAHSGLITP